MASLMNGGFHTRLGLHLLNTEERGCEPAPERIGPMRPGRPAWAFSGPVQARSFSRGSS
jgi:hypothetical protein